jgi:hypothetical protein
MSSQLQAKYASKYRTQKKRTEELKARVDKMNLRFDNVNDRFENVHLRMVLFEKSLALNGGSRRKRQIIESSEEEFGKLS